MFNQLIWVTARAAGLAALLLVSASISVGLLLSRRLGSGRGADLRVAHEALSISALAMIAVHVVALFVDSYFHASIPDLAVPFVRNYREPFMAIGIIGGWMVVVLGLSYYVRDAIGLASWRVIHRFTLIAWVLAVIHTLGEGSDSGEAWFVVVVSLALAPPTLFAIMRFGRVRELEQFARVLLRVPGRNG